MKFCQTHWDALRSAIRDRGLYDLVAKSGEAIVNKMAEELKAGAATATTFDPLMGAHNAILSRTMTGRRSARSATSRLGTMRRASRKGVLTRSRSGSGMRLTTCGEKPSVSG